jgi:hypothetical protein
MTVPQRRSRPSITRRYSRASLWSKPWNSGDNASFSSTGVPSLSRWSMLKVITRLVQPVSATAR